MNALERFAELASVDPDAPFLAVDDQERTRAAFLAEVGRCAAALQRARIGEFDVVVLCSPNRMEWCVAFWAAVSLGAIPAPLDPAIGSWELQQLLPLLKPRLIFATSCFRETNPVDQLRRAAPGCPVVAFEEHASGTTWKSFLDDVPLAPPPRQVLPSDTLLLACTSGTTGNPKILAVPHLGFADAQADMATYLGWTESDRVLLGMPLFHQGGFGMGLQALLCGAQARYMQGFDPSSFLNHVGTHHATAVQLTPTLAKILVSVPGFDQRVPSSWTMAYFAGETLPAELAARFWSDHGIRTINVVGSSETGTMLCWDSAHDTSHAPSDLSRLPFSAIEVGDEDGIPVAGGETGNLWVSTDGLFTRYEGNPLLTASCLRVREGRRWYRTGDLVHELPDGRVRFVGRSHRAVKRGPNLVHPEEVEAFLLGHPDIAAVAVGKEPHEVFGESLVAWIQPVHGTAPTRREVVEFCRGRIASFKIPDQMRFVERLPADLGKVQHIRLRTETP